MNQGQINTWISAFNEFNTLDCMLFNNISIGSIAEMQSSSASYSGSVSMLAADFDNLSQSDQNDLCEACNNATIAGILNKKVNTRPCEVR